MSRPDVACVCLDLGIHAAITVDGHDKGELVGAFLADHSGPGHVPEVPPRSWYGKAREFAEHLAQLRRESHG